MKNKNYYKMVIGNEPNAQVIYTAETKEYLEKILSDLKIKNTIKVEFIYVDNGKS